MGRKGGRERRERIFEHGRKNTQKNERIKTQKRESERCRTS